MTKRFQGRGRVFRSVVERREYLHDLDKRRNWVFLRVDRTKTIFTDLEDFAASLFPMSVKRQEAFVAIVKVFASARKALYLRDVVQRLHKQGPTISNSTINAVWKAMLRAGVVTRAYRGEPASLSAVLASRLEGVADYWRNYLESHGVAEKHRRRDAKCLK